MSETTVNNVFSNNNFRLVFFGALVSELGAILYSFAVGFYILEITDNNAFLQGLYLAVCGAALLLATPVGGVLGDRYNKAKIMFVCDYLKGGLIILATVLMIVFASNRAHLAILFTIGILGNIVSGIFSPAAGALLPHILDEQQLQQANSYFSGRSALLGILGVVLAGILYGVLPINLLFFIIGICYVLSGVSEMFIRYEHRASEEKLTLRLMFSDMGDGMRYMRSQKAIMALVVAILFINFFLSPIGSNFIPYFVKTDVASAPSYLFDGFLTPELWTSVFSMLIGISSLVGSIILSMKPQEEHCGHKISVRISFMAVLMLLNAVIYLVFIKLGVSLNAYLIIFSCACLLIGFILVFVNIPISTTLMRIVDKDKLSKVSSLLSVFSQGLTPIASVVAGAFIQYTGCTVLLFFTSAGFIVSALMLLFNKDVKEL